ncbi:hypothetical protein [Amycolatopsis japonica]
MLKPDFPNSSTERLKWRGATSLVETALQHTTRTRFDASDDRARNARRIDLDHIGRVSHNAARVIISRSKLAQRALTGTGRIRHEVMHTVSGLGVRRLTLLDRLHQFGLPDPRSARLPTWARV